MVKGNVAEDGWMELIQKGELVSSQVVWWEVGEDGLMVSTSVAMMSSFLQNKEYFNDLQIQSLWKQSMNQRWKLIEQKLKLKFIINIEEYMFQVITRHIKQLHFSVFTPN